MTAFYHPYAFIPVTGKVNGKEAPSQPFSAIKAGEHSHVRHDLWISGTFNGRIVCSATLKSPTVVGGQRQPGDKAQGRPAQLEPSRLGGRIVIPANSLRGMVATLAEALSQSSLRVLADSTYSVRKTMGTGVSAMGMVFIDPPKGDGSAPVYKILPLTLPTLERSSNQLLVPRRWLKVFGDNALLHERLPAYVHGYEATSRDCIDYAAGSFLDRHKPSCFHPKQNNQVFYAKLSSSLKGRKLSERTDIIGCADRLHQKRSYVVGQRLELEGRLLAKAEYESLPETEKNQYSLGVLYVLGIDGRNNDIPTGKTHERFLPKSNPCGKLVIAPQVLEAFEALAAERHGDDESLPFLPKGYAWDAKRLLPRHGDLIYFDVDEAGQVSEISYSSIWRRQVPGSLHESFSLIGENTLPWGSPKRPPGALTAAELMFGAVSTQKQGTGLDSCSLASRIRFSHGVFFTPPREIPGQILKILSSPKAPSPAMYFSAGKAPVKKAALNLANHKPNGRKYYLHNPRALNKAQTWATANPRENADQKTQTNLLAPDQTFYFHLDCHNLSQEELGLLIAALEPDSAYWHRLGLGKPLGLGSVQCRVIGAFSIDRVSRYTECDKFSRYASAFKVRPEAWDSGALRDSYPMEATAALDPSAHVPYQPNGDWVDTATQKIVAALGNPERLQPNTPVCYPIQDSARADSESEGFAWFANNERVEPGQALQPVGPQGDIQPLRSNSPPPHGR